MCPSHENSVPKMKTVCPNVWKILNSTITIFDFSSHHGKYTQHAYVVTFESELSFSDS